MKKLEAIVQETSPRLKSISEPDWTRKPFPHKWSKKEVLGHLVDSAQNNLRRFVVSQYRQNDKIVYHQDEWVQYQDYQRADTGELIQLWTLLNKQLVRTLRNIPAERLQYTCDTGKSSQELHTLEFLANDYLKHLRHHLSQIFTA